MIDDVYHNVSNENSVGPGAAAESISAGFSFDARVES